MRKELRIESSTSSCFYIPDVEYVRRKDSTMGMRKGILESSLKLHLLLPMKKCDTENGLWPLVIFVVGGGFRTPRVQCRMPWLARLAERGFVVAMPEYRGSEFEPFPRMMEDVHTAVRFLRIHAKQYGIDSEKVVMMGGSAGGHIALQTAYAPDSFYDEEDDLSIPADVCGVIDLYGTCDVRCMIKENDDIGSFVQSTPCRTVRCFERSRLEEALAPMSILQYVSKDTKLPPTMIAHGDSDDIVPVEQSDMLCEALEKAGKDVEYYRIKGAKHADPIFFGQTMMDLYEAFIRRVTGTRG